MCQVRLEKGPDATLSLSAALGGGLANAPYRNATAPRVPNAHRAFLYYTIAKQLSAFAELFIEAAQMNLDIERSLLLCMVTIINNFDFIV